MNKCIREVINIGDVVIQQMHVNFYWYAVRDNMIIDHDQYRHDLIARIERLVKGLNYEQPSQF